MAGSGVAYTYATLTAALQDALEDSFSDFTAFEDQLIGWGEAKLIRDFALSLWDSTDTSISTVANNKTINKPSGAISVLMLKVNGIQLEPRSHEFIDDYLSGASAGQPKYYNEIDETHCELAPKPDQIYAVEYQTVGRPAQLSTSTTTTFFSTYYGDLLFLACVIESERFEIADERLPTWQSTYAEKLPSAQNEMEGNMRFSGIRPLEGMPQPAGRASAPPAQPAPAG